MLENPDWESFSFDNEEDLEKWGIDSEELVAELEALALSDEDWEAMKFDWEELEQ